MADWSTLPKDLLLRISDPLRSSVDVLRFRSVCSAWRSTVLSQPNLFPIIPEGNHSCKTWGFCLAKLPIYRISIPPSPNEDTRDWIVKISKDKSGRMELINPFSADRFKPLQSSNLDLLKFRVYELGHEYRSLSFDYSFPNVYGETVAFRQVESPRCDGAAVLEYLKIRFGGLEMFKSGDERPNVMRSYDAEYFQVIVFKGNFYAIDLAGNVVMVESGLRIYHTADRVLGSSVKCLVESCGHLLLVDVSTHDDDDDDDDDDWDGDVDDIKQDYCDLDDDSDRGDRKGKEAFPDKFFSLVKEGPVRFKVYKLVESEKKWEKMESLGDQILLLGHRCTLSVSAADISGCEGNCVYTITRRNRGRDIFIGESQEVNVAFFHFGSSKMEYLTTESKHWQLFQPPPGWLSNAMSG